MVFYPSYKNLCTALVPYCNQSKNITQVPYSSHAEVSLGLADNFHFLTVLMMRCGWDWLIMLEKGHGNGQMEHH